LPALLHPHLHDPRDGLLFMDMISRDKETTTEW
jgi:hypothetical protein